jgi:transcriptional regulator with XRE-family HTH domain
MDCEKAGKMIRTLRLEKKITQKALASCLHLSDRTISKWERGLGYPDVALLPGLSELLGADIGCILQGDLSVHAADGGNIALFVSNL